MRLRTMSMVGLVVLALPLAACGSDSGSAGPSASTSASVSAPVGAATSSLPPLPAVPSMSPGSMDLPPAPDAAAVLAALKGLTQAQAEAKATAAGYTVRIASVDGQPRALTMDYSPSRINLDITGGVVTGATVG